MYPSFLGYKKWRKMSPICHHVFWNIILFIKIEPNKQNTWITLSNMRLSVHQSVCHRQYICSWALVLNMFKIFCQMLTVIDVFHFHREMRTKLTILCPHGIWYICACDITNEVKNYWFKGVWKRMYGEPMLFCILYYILLHWQWKWWLYTC